MEDLEALRRRILSDYGRIGQTAGAIKHWLDARLEECSAVDSKEIDEKLRRALDASEASFGETARRVEKACDEKFRAIREQAQKRVRLATAAFLADLAEIDANLTRHLERTGWLQRSFIDPAWKEFRPALQAPAPEDLLHVRIGRITVDSPWRSLEVSGAVPLLGQGHLLIRTDGSEAAATSQLVQNLLLRVLAVLPAGKVRFTFIDPVGISKNVAPFLHLQDHDRKLIDEAVRTRPRAIEECLSALVDHIADINSTYLRDEFPSITHFNAKASELAEPYRLVVVFDFPTFFETESLHHLRSVLQAGPRCGVHAVIVADTTKKLQEGFRLVDFEAWSTVLEWENGKIRLRDQPPPQRVIEPDPAPAKSLFRSVIQQVGQLAGEGGGVKIPFERVAPNDLGKATSMEEIRVPLGPADARRFQELRLGRGTAQHALIAGTTGAGKSNLLHVIITNISLLYEPGEVDLYLIDFKVGVEFKPYALRRLPTARVIAIESEREFGLSVLEGLNQELDRRGRLFKVEAVQDLASYRRVSGARMSRILLIIDEFHELLLDRDVIADHSSLLLDRLVREGRSMGIHVILCTQSFQGLARLPAGTFDQVAVRIALKMAPSESFTVLGDGNRAAAGLTRAGAAIYNDAAGVFEANRLFQVALLENEERERYLELVDQLWRKRCPETCEPIIFEGRSLAVPGKNTEIIAPPPVGRPPSLTAWLGEPVAIAPPVAVRLSEQQGHNLLVICSQAETASGLFATILLGIVARLKVGSARLILLDLAPPQQGIALPRIAKQLGTVVEIGRERDVPKLLGEVDEEVERRLAAPIDERSQEAPWALLLFGLQWSRMLRPAEPSFMSANEVSYLEAHSSISVSPQTRLLRILNDGPMVGIHGIVWCDSLTTSRRCLGSTMEAFDFRVAFQMSADDSRFLLDSDAAARLGVNRAVLQDLTAGKLVKFNPYCHPDEALVYRLRSELPAGWPGEAPG